ncbi:histidine phosphatase family protein [Pseudalkalibacillus hwajinpoensis]|uniref:histidine phosphatase family protein n=1 Tax=Guptibacillus hwajinpoensis TaxID=208199 RepID=UPI00325C0904
MKTTEVYLVRHAHSIYNSDEYGRGLSEEGREDQKRLTELMKNIHVDVILSSPYKRAIQTVEGIAKHINKPVQTIAGFKERALADGPVENFQSAIESVWSNEHFSLPGGESNEGARQRGILALKEVLHRYKGKRIVIGTHGNLMVLMMSYFNRSYDVHFWRNLDMPDVYRLTFVGEELMQVDRIWQRQT